MLHGIHTLGVLGATRVLDGDLDSIGNFDVLREAIGGLGSAFEGFFEVDVMHGEVECPRLRADQVFSLEKPSQRFFADGVRGPAEQLQISPISADDLRRESVALVQIAAHQTIDSNKENLRRLHRRLDNVSQPSLRIMQEVLDICRRNNRIPPENVAAICKVLDDAS
jgi:hypothetical protein